MKPLNNTITLRMETCSLDPGDSEDGTNLCPDQGCELGSTVRGQESWDSKPQNPGRDKNSCTGFSSDGGERHSLQPSRGSVDHGEDIADPLTQGQGPYQIQMNVRESSARDWNPRDRRSSISLNYTLLALETGSHPEANILGEARPGLEKKNFREAQTPG